jgi:hypothetical protein
MTGPSRKAAEAAQPPGNSSQVLSSGHQLSLHNEGTHSALAIVSEAGSQLVRIDLGPEGVELRAGALTLTWDERGGLRLEVDKLTIVGSQEIAIETPGDLSLRAGGRLTLSGSDQVIAATLGDVEIRANDNVAMSGERILLNS